MVGVYLPTNRRECWRRVCSYQRVHSQFGKEGKKQAVALYQRSADIAVLAYGYEHPVSVTALTELEAGFDTTRRTVPALLSLLH